jgi:hypothetical protein
MSVYEMTSRLSSSLWSRVANFRSQVVQRDAKSYMAVLLDDNNRKPIARLYFNRKQKYIGIFDVDK